VGDIIIPVLYKGTVPTFSTVFEVSNDRLPDKSRQNNEGYYAVVASWMASVEKSGDDQDHITFEIYYDVYKSEEKRVFFSDNFQAGDVITLKGTPLGLCDADGAAIAEIDGANNQIVFEKGVIREVGHYWTAKENVPAKEHIALQNGAVLLSATLPMTVKEGNVVFIPNVTEVPEEPVCVEVWDESKKCVVGSFFATAQSYSGQEALQMQEYTFSGATLTLKRAVPDLDFICESENRLWGVSNKDNTVYASKLGAPQKFFTYGNAGTDSYAVAVGSEDKFTAICSFGGGVCCFKEKKLHKIQGSNPAQYYMHEYEIAGVQQGAEKSLQIMGEVLFYKGVHGVYAYSGGTPKLISHELGQARYTSAVSASDGKAYYMGLSSEEGDELLVYDLFCNLWMCESKMALDALCLVGGKVHAASGGKVLRQDEDLARAEWSAEFAPMDKDLWGKKGYTSLTLKAEMEKGSALWVSVKEGGGEFKRVCTKTAASNLETEIPLRLWRCDGLTVKIEGKGKVILRGMLREFTEGGR